MHIAVEQMRFVLLTVILLSTVTMNVVA
jgi:hypothetical protein